MENYKVIENDSNKMVLSPEYKYTFSKKSGRFIRWGKTFADDPKWCPFGPEILDIEVSTICHAGEGRSCKFCYKKNTSAGKNMSFDTFKTVLDKVAPTIIELELENNLVVKLDSMQPVNTNRGLILAKDLVVSDVIIKLPT